MIKKYRDDKQIYKATQSGKSENITKVINIYFDSYLNEEERI